MRPTPGPSAPYPPTPQRPPNLGPMQGHPPPPWPPTFMPNRRQWYFSPPARGPGMWGMPRRFPMLPPLWQIPMLFSQIGMGLGQFGSGMLSPLGFGLNRYTLAFMNGMQKGQAQYTKQMREQMDLQADMADQQLQTELDDYNRVFREYGDPNNPNSVKPGNVDKLRQALYGVANKYHDQHMLSALKNNDIQGAIDQIKYLDQKHGDLKAGKTSRQTQAEKNAEEKAAPWGGQQPGQQQEGRHWPTSPADTGAPPPRAAAPAAEAGAAGGIGRLTNPSEEALARADSRGEAWTHPSDPGAFNRIIARSGQIRGGTEDAINNGKSIEDKLNGVKEWDPGLADEIQGALTFAEKPGWARGGMPARIAALAHRIDPNWNQNTYDFITGFQRSDGVTQRSLGRSQTMAKAATVVIEEAKRIIDKFGPEYLDKATGWQKLNSFIDKTIEGNPEFSTFLNAYSAYVAEMVGVTRQGTGNEADIQRSLSNTLGIGSIRQVLGAVRVDSAIASASIEANENRWNTITRGARGDAPGVNKQAMQDLRDIGTLNENNMTFGPDAQPKYKGLEPKGAGSEHQQDIEKRDRLEVPKEAVEIKKDKGRIIFKMPDGSWHEVY